MKKIILATCIASLLVGLASCETYDDLFPEYCHKVLNIKDGGEREVSLNTNDKETEFVFSVMKTGSEKKSLATGLVSPMAESEFKEYTDKYNILNSYLSDKYYIISDNTLSFSENESYKFVKVVFKTDEINSLYKESGKTYALPLKLTSNDANVNDSLLVIKLDFVSQ